MWHTIQNANGEGASGDLHHRTRHVNGGTKGHNKARNAFRYAIVDGLLQGNGYACCRRRGAQCGEIGRKHGFK